LHVSVREEIGAAVTRLGLDEGTFAEVPPSEARLLVSQFLAVFTGGVEAYRWWECFTLPSKSVVFKDGQAYQSLLDIVPDPDAHVWFVAEDDEPLSYPVYDATPRGAQQVIGECYYFEYYLISKDLSWLLCENHHDALIGVGAAIAERIPKGD
jgi:hypothetical protein